MSMPDRNIQNLEYIVWQTIELHLPRLHDIVDEELVWLKLE